MTELTPETVRNADDNLLKELIENPGYEPQLFALADKVRRSIYGNEVYLRGLIEFTNHCKNDCLYCGIRRSNINTGRYRLTEDQILECCETGRSLGYRTFVLQGGEDPYFTDKRICRLVSRIHKAFPECAITLSLGEKSRASYRMYFEAGARRYLLRHETADPAHYRMLHPNEMSLDVRKQCLFDLKETGYQVGSGFMVGSPFQTTENLISDLRFLQQLDPDMIGIGPFIHHRDTPFADKPDGTLSLTLRMIAILRLLFPKALIPATTALGSISPTGREQGLKVGANVLMPNLTPTQYRPDYKLYENKICLYEESDQCKGCLERRVKSAGYEIVSSIGDSKNYEPK